MQVDSHYFEPDTTTAARLIDNPIIIDSMVQSKVTLYWFIDLITMNIFNRSFFWSFFKSAPLPSLYQRQSDEVAYAGFEKETLYASQEWSPEQLFTYSEFFFPSPQSYLAPNWEHHARRVCDVFYRRLQQLRPLFPSYNRHKNTSRDTARSYIIASDSLKNPSEVTTLDLEKMYVDHGIKIAGPCELRTAWKFNDLKPRLYYAQGGTDYFAARYMKKIAVALMESFPMSSTANRRDPTTFLNNSYWDSGYVVNWDLTSFTTNLSEAKHFVYMLARLMENEYGDHATVPLYDLRTGIQHVPIWEILDAYNETCNCSPQYSRERLIEIFNLDLAEFPIMSTQANNGMLGVPGNIGIATSLHGIIAAKIVGPRSVVCVGDDAIALVEEDYYDDLQEQIQTLGDIQVEKFSVMDPHIAGKTQYGRFLKRRLTRNDDGLALDDLINLPPIPYVTGIVPRGRITPFSFTIVDRLRKVVGIVGRILDQFRGHFFDDYCIIRSERYFLAIYQEMRIGRYTRGSLPGAIFLEGDQAQIYLPFCIPPVNFRHYDPTTTDWVDWLINSSSPKQSVRLPLQIESSFPDRPSYEVGQIFYSSSNRQLTVLEDFGHVERTSVTEEILVSDRVFRSRLKLLIRDSSRTYMYTVIKDMPEWFLGVLESGPFGRIAWDNEMEL
jgi:hypothetical protein